MTTTDTELLERLENPMAMGVQPVVTMKKAAERIRSLQGEVEKREGANRQLVEELGRSSERLEHAASERDDLQSQLSEAKELLERSFKALDAAAEAVYVGTDAVLAGTGPEGKRHLEAQTKHKQVVRGFELDVNAFLSRTTPATEKADV